MLRAPALIATLALAACAQPLEERVAAQLTGAGLSGRVANCMAERWVDRLSVLQLQRIADTAAALRDEGGRLTPRRFANRVRELDDPEITEVVTNSALVCALTA